MNTKEKCLLLLSGFQSARGSDYSITRMGIFGSVARGEQKPESDIDIYFEGEPLSLFKLTALKEELEELLQSNVDIVRLRNSMNLLLKKRIKKEGIYV